ncbi:MAG: hypothetical protein IAE91_12840 [Ignavibacteriaceae bacterium]|nr:hypothetical protein [Ignavibacteriaceae bacterium]
MKNLSEKITKLNNQTDKEKGKLEQVSQFDVTIEELKKITNLQKPTYNLPLVDTIGKHTHSSLNNFNK